VSVFERRSVRTNTRSRSLKFGAVHSVGDSAVRTRARVEHRWVLKSGDPSGICAVLEGMIVEIAVVG